MLKGVLHLIFVKFMLILTKFIDQSLAIVEHFFHLQGLWLDKVGASRGYVGNHYKSYCWSIDLGGMEAC
jgi:hypothetical protein